MPRATNWVCDVCSKMFEHKHEAEDCEGKHMVITHFRGVYEPGAKYPHRVVVELQGDYHSEGCTIPFTTRLTTHEEG